MPKLLAPPNELKKYFWPNNDHEIEMAKTFQKKIREYNSMLSFASIRAKLRAPPGRGDFCFRIQGRIYHSVPPLLPNTQGNRLEAAQFYVLDTKEIALQKRLQNAAAAEIELDNDVNLLDKNKNIYIHSSKNNFIQ